MTAPSLRRGVGPCAVLLLVAALVLATPVAGPRAAAEGPAPAVTPTSGHRFDVDLAELRSGLASGPTGLRRGASTVSLVDPEGREVAVQVRPSPVMAAGLAADHPQVSAYRGHVVGRPDRSVHLDVGPLGLHASVRGGSAPAFYVDPLHRASSADTPGERHVSYRAGALVENREPLVEDTKALAEQWTATVRAPLVDAASDRSSEARAGGPVTTRVYRLAMVTDPTFARYHGGTAAATLQAKVAIVERVNQVYLSDFGAELELVEGNDELDLRTETAAFEPGGPCGSEPCFLPRQTDDCGPVLGRASFITGQVLGADTFDLGHVMLGRSGGGVAGYAVAGTAGKSIGCTGSEAPVGDGYAIDYVAHELGHQMSGAHTFDGCGSGEGLPSRVEPGSGSTIMAYAGICGEDNLQGASDAYMSAYTVREVGGFMAADLAERADEWQTLSLEGFDADGDSVRLGWPGATPVTLTRGRNYTAEGVRDAVEDLTGHRPVVFALDKLLEVDPRDEREPTDRGFGFSFVDAGDGGRQDLPRLRVAGSSSGVRARVGVIVDGGRPENGGHRRVRSGNRHPSVTAPTEVTIPTRTSFTLTGAGTDPDGDRLGYAWEQVDDGGANGPEAQPLASDRRLDGPLFRVFGTAAGAAGRRTVTPRPSRTFPDLAQVLAGHTNAETGSCAALSGGAALDCYSELLPTADYARSAGPMHFRLTARDSDPAGGGLATADTTVRVDPTAGPFLVTGTPTGRVAGGTRSVLRWRVNGTRPLASQVRVTMSLDGGRTYPVALTGPVPNTGRTTVTWPRRPTDEARIRIQAVDNVFFAVGADTFRLVDPGR